LLPIIDPKNRGVSCDTPLFFGASNGNLNPDLDFVELSKPHEKSSARKLRTACGKFSCPLFIPKEKGA
ncbi:MAG: hypothetical protein IJW09_05785, partial [Clostridia bacterium]|nr:hypothetical protein [Clostridia bacterium]